MAQTNAEQRKLEKFKVLISEGKYEPALGLTEDFSDERQKQRFRNVLNNFLQQLANIRNYIANQDFDQLDDLLARLASNETLYTRAQIEVMKGLIEHGEHERANDILAKLVGDNTARREYDAAIKAYNGKRRTSEVEKPTVSPKAVATTSELGQPLPEPVQSTGEDEPQAQSLPTWRRILSLPFLGRYGYFQLGWAETVDDCGQLVEQYKSQVYDVLIKQRGLAEVVLLDTEKMLGGRWKELEVVRSGLATSLLIVESYGNDLYLSWRVFIRRPFATWKFIVLPIVSIIGILTVCLTPLVIAFWTLVVVQGLLRFNDIFYVFRAPLREFHYDDALALSITLDKAVRDAAEQLNIQKKLSPAPQFSSMRQTQYL